MTSDAVQDKVFDAMKQFKFEVIASNLSKEQEDKLLRQLLPKNDFSD